MLKLVFLGLLTAVGSLLAAEAPEPVLAKRGKLLFADDMSAERGKKPANMTNGWRAFAAQGLWEKRDKVYRSTWEPGVGHTPVAAYRGKGRDMIIEVTFRYGAMDPMVDWHTQCMRIAVDNRQLYTGHVLSAWANPNNDFIETGFLLQHIRKTPKKKIVSDLLLDRQPLTITPKAWAVATLEVVGDEALFRMGDHLAYCQLDELNVDKTTISITLGKTWHELRSVRVWEALPNPKWPGLKAETLSKRKPFKPMKHAYVKPVKQK